MTTKNGEIVRRNLTMNRGERALRMLKNEALRRQLSYRGKMSTLPIEEQRMEVRAQISENAWRDIRTVGMDTFLKRFNHEVARRLKV